MHAAAVAAAASPAFIRGACIAAMRSAEPVQREDHKKLSKHAKKRAKEDRERQIRDAELRRLQVSRAEPKRCSAVIKACTQ
jgi:hypothetical protein